MSEVVTALLMLFGGLFLLIAGIGLIRMPDLMLRMHSSSKAGTLGVGLIVFSVATYYLELGITVRAVAAVFFIFLTVPVAAHVIARAAYLLHIQLWPGTVVDELKGHYDDVTHQPDSDSSGTRHKTPDNRPAQ